MKGLAILFEENHTVTILEDVEKEQQIVRSYRPQKTKFTDSDVSERQKRK